MDLEKKINESTGGVVKLPFDESFFRHSPRDSYLFSILINYKDSWPWIMQNFINIEMRNDGKYDNFFRNQYWFDCPFLYRNLVERNLYKAVWDKSFCEFAIKCLSNNYYVYAFINKKYISEYRTARDDEHNLIIWGMDASEKKFYIADFFSKIYKTVECSFEEMEFAFQRYDDIPAASQHNQQMCLLQYNDGCKYDFSVALFKEQMQNYLTSKNLEDAYFKSLLKGDVSNRTYGLNVYDLYKKFIVKNKKIYYRPFNLFYMKAMIMDKRLNYLCKYNLINNADELIDINNRYKEIAEQALLFAVKQNIKIRQNDIELAQIESDLIFRVEELKTLDTMFIGRLYSSFK